MAVSELPSEVQATVSAATDRGVTVIPAADVAQLGAEAGLTDEESDELAEIYRESQLSSLRVAFVGLILISLLSILFSRGIPAESMVRRRTDTDEVPLRD
ncbi:hypothetical protein [Microbacterium hydrocarbonoxydans]|uniref:hypothetical protein n=1 Tax=Microbacterium hydrocarbonoxydans TaxID=273678 RepID=UPI0020C90E3B|nr:hypothetical protein [Microbacterium hydrocarbonoxydans]